MGYVKAAVSLTKYCPQAWMNCKDKSTTGWSIVNVVLDFTGGTLSFAQQIMDSWNYNDWETYFYGNVPKLILALESIIFDVIFMVQHYCLFGDRGRAVLSSDAGPVAKIMAHSPAERQ